MAGFMSDLAAEGAIQWRQIRTKGTNPKGTNPKGTNPTGANQTNNNTCFFASITHGVVDGLGESLESSGCLRKHLIQITARHGQVQCHRREHVDVAEQACASAEGDV